MTDECKIMEREVFCSVQWKEKDILIDSVLHDKVDGSSDDRSCNLLIKIGYGKTRDVGSYNKIWFAVLVFETVSDDICQPDIYEGKR